MIADYKIRDAVVHAEEKAFERGIAEENNRLINMLETKEIGLTPEQKEMLLKEFSRRAEIKN